LQPKAVVALLMYVVACSAQAGRLKVFETGGVTDDFNE
jgi:hypothetical protein